MIYIFVFLLTGLLIYQSEYYKRKNKWVLGNIFAVLVILIVSIFAGIRDISVGTDVEYYVIKHFNWVALFPNQMWKYIIYLVTYDEVEPIYALVQYIGYSVFHSINFVLFMLSLITHIFIYFGLVKKAEQISISTAWLIYCFLFYNTTLNIVRQSCAVAIIFYMVMCILEEKISVKKYIILTVIALGFHRSSLLMAIILPLLIWSYNNKIKRNINYIIVFVLCLFPFFFKFIGSFISSLNSLPMKYQVFFNDINSGQSSIMLDTIIYLLPTILFIYLAYKQKTNVQIKFYLVMAFVSISCCVASNLMISRLSYYFIIFFCYSIPYSTKIISTRANGRQLYRFGMIGWFALMWYINIVNYGYGATYPYVLGI